MKTWTPERDKQLMKLWQQGKKGHEIAAIMGIDSRSGVLARIKRLREQGKNLRVRVFNYNKPILYGEKSSQKCKHHDCNFLAFTKFCYTHAPLLEANHVANSKAV